MERSIKKTLLDIAGPIIEQGFTFESKMSGKDTWRFSRQAGEITQYIIFDKSRFEPAVRLSLQTSHDPAGIFGAYLVGREEIWLRYSDDESLSQIFSEMMQLLVEKGMQWFEFSAKGVPKSSEEVARGVLLNLEERVRRFENQLGLDHTHPGTVAGLEQAIRIKVNASEEVDWEFLCDAAAYFGELVRFQFGGVWEWDVERMGFVLYQIGGCEDLNPLFHTGGVLE